LIFLEPFLDFLFLDFFEDFLLFLPPSTSLIEFLMDFSLAILLFFLPPDISSKLKIYSSLTFRPSIYNIDKKKII
jgi:hypothetical protein